MLPNRRHVALCLALAFVAAPALATPPEKPAAGPQVKLLDAGKDPKTPLRFTAKVGQKRTVVTSIKMEMEVSVGGTKMPAGKIPETRMTMDVAVTNVAANGDIRYTFKINKPEVVDTPGVLPQVLQTMKTSVAEVEGLSGHAVVTSRGFTKEADIKAPAAVNPQTKQLMDSLKQSVQQFASPFPEEAVGPGAKWETVTRISQGGMTIDQTAILQLVSVTGNTAKMLVDIKQTAAPQKVTAPGMPPGASVDLQSLESSGKADMVLDLTQLAPTSSNMNLTTNSKMSMTMGAQKQDMAMKMDMIMGIQAK